MKKTKSHYYSIFAGPFIVLLIHIIGTLTGVYETFRWFDIPMHFLGGASIATSAYFILKRTNPLPLWVTMALMVGGTSMMAVGWEWSEYILDFFLHTTTQLGIFDALKDMYNGIVGASLIALVVMIKALRAK